ncbi:hypothetical protein N8D56_15330 [Devosia sp. A8/3-2]|nr:hypothetical protein N8D56_15330 [Devosia sp. A8/3-2]
MFKSIAPATGIIIISTGSAQSRLPQPRARLDAGSDRGQPAAHSLPAG